MISKPGLGNITINLDWRDKGAVSKEIKLQGPCGACYAFASTAVLESAHFLKTGVLHEFSP